MDIIDVHAHYGSLPWTPCRRSNIKGISEMLDELNVKKCIVSSIDAIVYDINSGNEGVKEAIKRDGRMRGYVTINANYVEESKALVEEYIVKHGFIGVKVHPDYSHQPIDSPNTLKILATADALRVPILVHTYGKGGVADPAHVLSVVKHYPDLTIILGHMGGDNWRGGIDTAAKGDNIYVDPCSCTQPHADKIKEAVNALGAERILFGTDMPLLHPSWALGMVESADIATGEREMILHHNAKRIWGSI